MAHVSRYGHSYSSGTPHYAGAASMLGARDQYETAPRSNGAGAMPLPPIARSATASKVALAVLHAAASDDDDDDPTLISRSMGMPRDAKAASAASVTHVDRRSTSQSPPSRGRADPYGGSRSASPPSAATPSSKRHRQRTTAARREKEFTAPAPVKAQINGWMAVLQLVPYDQGYTQQSLISPATGPIPFRLLNHALDQSKVLNLRASMHAGNPWVIFPEAHGNTFGTASHRAPRGSPTHGRAASHSPTISTPPPGGAASGNASSIGSTRRTSPSPPGNEPSAAATVTAAGSPSAAPAPVVSFGANTSNRGSVPRIPLPPVQGAAAHNNVSATGGSGPTSGRSRGAVADAAALAVTVTPRTRAVSSSPPPPDTARGKPPQARSAAPGASASVASAPRARQVQRGAIAGGDVPIASSSSGSTGAVTTVSPRTQARRLTTSSRPPSGRPAASPPGDAGRVSTTITPRSSLRAAMAGQQHASSTALGAPPTPSAAAGVTGSARPPSRLASIGSSAVSSVPTAAPQPAAGGSDAQGNGVKNRVGTFFRSLIGTSGKHIMAPPSSGQQDGSTEAPGSSGPAPSSHKSALPGLPSTTTKHDLLHLGVTYEGSSNLTRSSGAGGSAKGFSVTGFRRAARDSHDTETTTGTGTTVYSEPTAESEAEKLVGSLVSIHTHPAPPEKRLGPTRSRSTHGPDEPSSFRLSSFAAWMSSGNTTGSHRAGASGAAGPDARYHASETHARGVVNEADNGATPDTRGSSGGILRRLQRAAVSHYDVPTSLGEGDVLDGCELASGSSARAGTHMSQSCSTLRHAAEADVHASLLSSSAL